MTQVKVPPAMFDVSVPREDRHASTFRVLHVIDSLGGSGGAENRLVEEVVEFDPTTEHLVIRLFEPDDLDQRLIRAGIGVVPIGLRASRGSYNWPLAALRIAKVIRRFRPHVVHTSLFAGNLAGQLAARASRLPVVSTMTLTGDPELLVALGYQAHTARARAMRRVGRWSAEWSRARWRAVTEDTKLTTCQALSIPPDRVTVIHRGVARHRASATSDRRRFDVPPGPMLLNVARHAPQKGHQLLIQAFVKIVASVPNAQLVIAGKETRLTPSFRLQAETLGIGDRVHFLGYRNDSDVLMASADVFLFSSLAEGIASAVLEAVVARLPVVSFDIPPIREVTEPGGLAELVPVGDIDAFASAAITALESRSDLRLLERRREWVLDHFYISDIAADVEQLLRDSARH